ncbi:hypothetical protein ABC855_g2519 [[Candida] zeylanoides]
MKSEVRQMYKNLLYLGKEYPQRSGGFSKFRRTLKSNFARTPVDTAEQLASASARAKHVEKELEALYFLSRYRDMKRKYYD